MQAFCKFVYIAATFLIFVPCVVVFIALSYLLSPIAFVLCCIINEGNWAEVASDMKSLLVEFPQDAYDTVANEI